MKVKPFAKRGSVFVLAAGFVMVLGVATSFCYDAKSPLTLKVGIKNPPHDVVARTIKRFTDQVEKKTEGRIKFNYYYNETLITGVQFVDGVSMGIADISTGPTSFLTGKIPEFSIFEVFGSFPQEKYTTDIEPAIRAQMKTIFNKVNVHPLMPLYSGSAVFNDKKEFLKSPEQWKGKKMRMGGKWQGIVANKWGASPIFLPPSELYMSLQRGTIDGYFLVYSIISGLKLYEVAPFIVDSGFSCNIEVVTMNQKKYEGLTPSDRKIFDEIAVETVLWNKPETIAYEKEVRDAAVKSGAKVYDLTQAEQKAYLKYAYEVWPEVRKISGPLGNQLMDILEKFREK
jgi:C4-dicarboxylate-binding protein DctP